jgi:hypothetical protein
VRRSPSGQTALPASLRRERSTLPVAQEPSFFNTVSSYAHHRKGGKRNYRGQVDYFAVYVPQIQKYYLVPVDVVGTKEGVLRLEPTKNKQEKHIRWAKEYEL